MQSILKRTLSVSQVNEYIALGMQHDPILRNIRIRGEISNLRLTAAGHCYLALKDEGALINCVCFKSQYLSLPFDPKDGQNVCAIGYVSVYAASGQMQLYIQDMEKEGLGELYEAYEKLKLKLEKKGYFSNERKKAIPKYPSKIAVITSETGAVIHDFIRVAWRRNGAQKIILIPSKVQGTGAAEEIASSIAIADDMQDVDLIVLARGGGSIEDLWSFNEEIVADAIFNSKKPIVSAIGHESDFTIADFVSDLRASTPSQAAELTTPVLDDAHAAITKASQRMISALQAKISSSKLKLAMKIKDTGIENLSRRIRDGIQNIDELSQELIKTMDENLQNKQATIDKLLVKLKFFGSDSALKRGYSLIAGADGIISSIEDLSADEEIKIKMIDGSASAVVKNIYKSGVE